MTKILVIEDEAMLRTEVAGWLAYEGYEVVEASDGIAGVEAALHHLPDLIISDINMPKLDGYGVLLEIQANPSTTGIPFIFLTARTTYEDIRKGMSYGADDYLTKPFTLDQLLQTVQIRLIREATREETHRREVDVLLNALAQEQEQRIVKTKLIGMFSHDFRNPLAGILSSNGLLRDYADRMDAERRLMHLNRIDGLVRQLMQMLDDMLVIAQMESGSFDYRPEPLDIREFLAKIVEEFRDVHAGAVDIAYQPHTADTAHADIQLMRHIFANLISNAIKYSPQAGKVTVTLHKADGVFVVAIRDNGIGVPQADLARLFEAFRRGSNVGSISGTGLGLAIVKQAVDLHGGTINFESEVGQGTTVTVTIPGG